jgi:hypothetical protein
VNAQGGIICLERNKKRKKKRNEKGGRPGRPASFISPLGESGQSDGGRLAGRVLAYLYNPGLSKKVPQKAKKYD